jgi:molybdate transport system substrate-binding protein
MSRRIAAAIALALLTTGASAADLVVSAASSLTDAFTAVGHAYEQKHPGTKVVLNFAASDVLMQQIANGAPADVFASADQQAMDKATAQGIVQQGSRRDFATNQLVVVVPVDGKASVATLNDLKAPAVRRIAIGDPASVPVGRYTQAALASAGLWDGLAAKLVLGQNVRQALDYVARGEVDAGFVFATDATAAKDKVRVAIRVPSTTPITYPIATVAQSKQPAQAQAFEAFVLSPEGQGLLGSAGFGKP